MVLTKLRVIIIVIVIQKVVTQNLLLIKKIQRQIIIGSRASTHTWTVKKGKRRKKGINNKKTYSCTCKELRIPHLLIKC